MAERAIWNEAQEMATYHPGQKVEIRHLPGVIDTVIAYDPMMVPPIVLASDPQPRYPEELILVSHAVTFDWLRHWSKAASNRSRSVSVRGASVVPNARLTPTAERDVTPNRSHLIKT